MMTTETKEYVLKSAILIAVLLPALYVRLLAMEHALPQSLERDALAFLALAQKPVSLFAASEREPFFIFLHRLALLACQNQPWAIRLQSFIFSLVMIGLVTFISLRLFKIRVWSLLSGLLVALTPFMVFSSTRGLRMELYFTLTVGLQALLTLPDRPLSWPRAVIAGFIAGAMCLTRGVGIVVALGVFAVSFFKLGLRFGFRATALRIGSAVLLATALAFPFYYNQHRRFGTAFYISTRDATNLRNNEFRDQPGFPTSADILRDP